MKIGVNIQGETSHNTCDADLMSQAVAEFFKRAKAKEFGHLLRQGAFDFSMTNEELEKAGAL